MPTIECLAVARESSEQEIRQTTSRDMDVIAKLLPSSKMTGAHIAKRG